MDSPQATSPVLPQLEYAPQPSVGDLTLSRSGGTTIITIKPSLQRVLRILWAGIVVGVASFAAMIYVLVFRYPSVNPTPFIIVFCIGMLVATIGIFKPVVIILNIQKWTASVTGLELTGRRLTDILREVYPRPWIADLRVESIRLQNHLLKIHGLVMFKPDGNKVLILRGTNAELEFACRAFREALQLPADPLGALEYPKPKFLSRIKYRLVQGGVILTLYPPMCGLGGLAIILTSVPLFAWVDTMLARSNPGINVPPIFSALGVLRIFLWCLLVDGILLGLMFKARRATTLLWTQEGLGLHERSLFRPCSERWPADSVERVMLQAVSTRRANLALKLKDGSVQPLMNRESVSEVEIANSMLNTAITQSRRQ